MKQSLTNRWASWVSASTGVTGVLTLRTIERTVLPQLRQAGFDVPSTRALVSTLEAGLVPVTANDYGFAHILNLVWQPLLRYIEGLAAGEEPTWTKALAVNQAALHLEMEGIVLAAATPQAMDEWTELIAATLVQLAGVEVPRRLITTVVSGVAPLPLAPTPAMAMSLLRSGLAEKLLGPTLAMQVNRRILAKVADLDVPLLPDADVSLGVKKDCVATLEQLHCEPLEDEAPENSRPAKRMRKDKGGMQGRTTALTQQVIFALDNRVPFSRVSDTVCGAEELIADLSGTSASSREPRAEELLVGRWALMRHMLVLDGAIDRCTSERLFRMREEGTFAGVALATDESPPSQPRFRGLRFQISVMYLGSFVPRANWEGLMTPPILCTSMLGDIMHCPGKKGTDVSRVVEKQLARVGLNPYDVVAGTGDGGGENEGHTGLHSHFEDLNPGYVRRRCLPHIAWRTSDMAIRSSRLDYKALAAYFVDGITWSRLRQIATTSQGEGGLQLFRDGSTRCKEVFGKSPSAIILTRPETDLKFLRLLNGKEHTLHRLATKDLEQRSLGADTAAAIQNLGDITQRIRRALLCEILERCMFLLYWSAKNPMVAEASSLEDLLGKASSTILDLSVTQEVLDRFAANELMHQPKTWVHLAVFTVVGDETQVGCRLEDAFKFHRDVTDKASAHLTLLAENTLRTPWLAAKLLSTDPPAAKEAAVALATHISTARPANRTQFEGHVFGTQELWDNLVAFSTATPPILLWHGHGKYEALFRFLAPRFLLAPDHVLDAERVHARWQWSCTIKRGLKLHSLNAFLRLVHFQENNQVLPPHEDLFPHVVAERAEHKVNLEAIEADGEVALGWRSTALKTRQETGTVFILHVCSC